MKIAIFYSYQAKGFLNHWLRLSGFLAENPEAECVWFDLSQTHPYSEYSLAKFDKFILLTDKENLSGYRLPLEVLPVESALKVKPRFLSHCDERWVFCASKEKPKNWNRKFWEAANKSYPTLFLCQEQGVLEEGASPGPLTFFSPVTPQLHQEAIINASCVISTSWEPCLVARAAGKTAIKISDHVSADNRWGFPEVIAQGKKASEVFRECYQIYKAEAQLRKTEQGKPLWSNFSQRSFHLTSVSDSAYLPFYLGMIENVLRKTKQGVHFHLLALDDQVRPFLEQKYPGLVNVVELKDVWNPRELKIIEQRSMAFRAFSSKPKILEKVLRETQSPIFYCDSDVYFFGPPENLIETFSSGHTVVFPHWNDVYPKGREDGLYNAGMVGVRPGAERFLKWWGEQCLVSCSFDPENGVVGDQAYLDFAPILFDGVTVYRKKDHNIARWNLKSLGIRFSSNRRHLETQDGRLVQTFHAAFIDSPGFFEFKYCWDQLITFFSGFSETRASSAFLKNVLVQQQRYWLSLARGLKGREMIYRILPFLGEQPESKAPEFWMNGFGGVCLNQALKLRDILFTQLSKINT